jgi:hypothetical protein
VVIGGAAEFAIWDVAIAWKGPQEFRALGVQAAESQPGLTVGFLK